MCHCPELGNLQYKYLLHVKLYETALGLTVWVNSVEIVDNICSYVCTIWYQGKGYLYNQLEKVYYKTIILQYNYLFINAVALWVKRVAEVKLHWSFVEKIH